MKNLKEYLKAEDIEFFLANTPQITFEVTDACNLKCTYCGYGEFYSDCDFFVKYKQSKAKNYVNKNYLENILIIRKYENVK